MAYVKNTWVDQEGQIRYRETQDGDFKILTPNYEQVTEIGTPVNADNMNHIEEGIQNNDVAITTINSKIPNDASVSNKMATQADLDNKTDIDLSNAIPAQNFKNSVISWAMPDYSAGISLSVNTNIVLTQDSFIVITGANGGGAYDNMTSFYINGQYIAQIPSTYKVFGTSFSAYVGKGETIKVQTSTGVNNFVAYPLKGETNA